MEVDWIKHLGEKVIDKNTGEIRTIASQTPHPSVTLFDKNNNREDWIGFCEGSPVSKDWEIYEEETSSEFLIRIGTDGSLWAKEFMKLFEDSKDKIDESLMTGWFYNAIESGKSSIKQTSKI